MLDVFESGTQPGEPRTTAEVTTALDEPRGVVREVLDHLETDGLICGKHIDGGESVWWASSDGENPFESWEIDPELVTQQVREVEFRSDHMADMIRPVVDVHFLATVEGIVPIEDGGQLEYWVVRDTEPGAFVEALSAFPTFVDVRLLSTAGNTSRIEVEVTSDSLMSTFGQFDGRMIQASIDLDHLKMVGEFPLNADVSAFLEDARETIKDLSIVSQQLAYTPRLFEHLVKDDLTTRQWTSLQAAYYSGYFDTPRQSTGDEIAESLGVTRQTFHHHLRHAESKLCQNVFNEVTQDEEDMSDR